MRRSESTAKLAEALAKAQGAMKPAVMGSTNPHFRSKYASLAEVMDAIREPFAANGLAVVQGVDEQDDSGLTITTTLLHGSGEWIESSVHVPVGSGNAQQVGSALTYARRYSLSALCGVVADEDDDGNAAAASPAPPATQAAPRKTFAKGTIPFGKSKGTPLKEMDRDDLSRALAWARDNKPDLYAAFIEEATEVLASTDPVPV